MKKDKLVRIYAPFEDTIRKKYPDLKSLYQISKKLNEELNEILYRKKR